jgi:hypothetical protein
VATTLDALLALLPDNQTGAISAADLRDVVTGLWGVPYVGQVASDGTLVGGPPGWSSSLDPTTGLYTVQHDLGTEAYAVVVTPMAKVEGGYAPAVEATTPTSFTYGVWSSTAGGLHGMYTNFVVGVL